MAMVKVIEVHFGSLAKAGAHLVSQADVCLIKARPITPFTTERLPHLITGSTLAEGMAVAAINENYASEKCLAAEATGRRLSPAPDLAARLPQFQRARAPAADHPLRIRVAGGVEFLEQAEIALAVVGEEAVSEHAGLSTM